MENGMKQLVTLIVAGMMGVMLVACGGKPAPKQPEVQTQEQAAPAPEAARTQEAAPAPEAAPAEEAAPAAPEAAKE